MQSEYSKRVKENNKLIKHYEKEKNRNKDISEYSTKMKDDENIVEFDNLKTHFFTDAGVVKAIDGVTFNIKKGKTIAIVGESGCGKSVTSLSLMRLVSAPTGQITGGQIRYNREGGAIDIANAPIKVMQKLRGNEIGMIFQEPMTSLNPVFTIGKQLDEMVNLHVKGATKNSAKERSIEMLRLVGIARAEGIYNSYPHELSGGMRQRVMIAMAISCNPQLIIADEPTTALDVTIQAQILELLRDLKDKINSSIMLITHDLGVVAEMADYVVVMYAGRVIEQGIASDIYNNPSHPYTIGLLQSKPVVGKQVERLYSIPGQVPNPISMPTYCYFKDRCEKCIAECEGAYPETYDIGNKHNVACYLYKKEGNNE